MLKIRAVFVIYKESKMLFIGSRSQAFAAARFGFSSGTKKTRSLVYGQNTDHASARENSCTTARTPATPEPARAWREGRGTDARSYPARRHARDC